jgi:hypothetical protein
VPALVHAARLDHEQPAAYYGFVLARHKVEESALGGGGGRDELMVRVVGDGAVDREAIEDEGGPRRLRGR